MGKHRKLRSATKILHEALTSFTPSVAGPFCVHPSKTHSSRDLNTTFKSVHCTPSSSTSSSDNPSSHNCLFLHPQSQGDVKEEPVPISAASSSRSPGSGCRSSSSLAVADGNANDLAETLPFPSGTINSRRFFFSPCSSKSITKQAEHEVGICETEETEEHDNVKAFDAFAEIDTETVPEVSTTTAAEKPALCREGIAVAVASRDPYGDFRSSMEEMVMAHGLRDWPSMKELLNCYLHLNEKTTHEVIVLAFVDLLMHLASGG